MALLLRVHHIRYAVKNITKFVQLLKLQLQFCPYATRSTSTTLSSDTIVLKHQDVIFVIDKREESKVLDNKKAFCASNTLYPVDTICDVCLECSDLEELIKSISLFDINCIKIPLTILHDTNGAVKYAVIKPPFGNIQHTLLDLSDYNGSFLPEFELIKSSRKSNEVVNLPLQETCLIQTIDHVAYAVNIGQTDSIMNWYNNCMGFNRLIINVNEDEKEGFVVQEGLQGLRLKAMFGPLMHLSKCEAPLHKAANDIPKFVFCEALSDDCKADQVSHFMHMHQGPGVQHVAFSTNNIIETVTHFKNSGLNCVLPPESYYAEVSKDKEIKQLQYDVETLKNNNILLESNLSLPKTLIPPSSLSINSINVEDQIRKMSSTQWFIMQVFTSPVFQEKTLFFEIIQRFQTISGFGAGNIGALWRAVQKELFDK